MYVFIYLAASDLRCCMWDLSLRCTGSRAHKLSSCTVWGLKSLVKDQTCIPCIGRQILNLWTTKEVPLIFSDCFPVRFLPLYTTLQLP